MFFRDFIAFIKEQGVVGLAVGFIFGGALSSVVSSLVEDIINPLLGLLFGADERLSALSATIGGITIRWGSFLASAIDFMVIALVVFAAVRMLGIPKPGKGK